MKLLTIIFSTFLLLPSFCHTSDWNFKGMFGGTLNTTGVSGNWSGEEKDSTSWGFKLDVSAEKDNPNINWVTSFKEEYGKTKTEGSEEQTNADLIDINSVYTKKFSLYINPYTALNINTQNWRFFDPVTFTESLGNGLWLINKEAQKLKTRTGLALKQTFDPKIKVTDAVTGMVSYVSSTDDPETESIEESRYETGGEWVTNYEVIFQKNLKISSEARVFSAFKGGANLWWDSSLSAGLSRYAAMQVNYLTIYNYNRLPHPVWHQDVERRLTLVFGLSYNFF